MKETGYFDIIKTAMNRKRLIITTYVDIDFKFWSLIPSININMHYRMLEFEWLCIGIYTSISGESDEEQS